MNKTAETKFVDWIEETTDGILIRLKVQPGSSVTKVRGLHGNPPRLKIQVAAPPEDGKANEKLLKFLKKTLDISTCQVQIIRGTKSNIKDILCKGPPLSQIKKVLMP